MKTLTLNKFLLIIFLLAIALPTTALAQDPNEPDVTTADLPSGEWAGNYFRGENLQIENTITDTSVETSWRLSESYSAIVLYTNHQVSHPYYGIFLSALVDSNWLSVVMSVYEEWEVVERCYDAERLTVELLGTNDGTDFIARYWVWSEGSNFITAFASYERDYAFELERLADHFFPDHARCGLG